MCVLCVCVCVTVLFYTQAALWDPVNLEIASSRKLKWLRERVGTSSPHTMLLNQIKNFVLTDEVNVKVLSFSLKTQVRNEAIYTNNTRLLDSNYSIQYLLLLILASQVD